MEQRKHARTGDRKNRHGLSETVDPRYASPDGAGRGSQDEGPGMAHADPPDEIRDRECPPDRHVDAPDADAPVKQASDGEVEDHKEAKRNAEPEQPPASVAVAGRAR